METVQTPELQFGVFWDERKSVFGRHVRGVQKKKESGVQKRIGARLRSFCIRSDKGENVVKYTIFIGCELASHRGVNLRLS